MARKTSKRPVSTARRTRFQPHDLLLAGLGAVSLGRRQVLAFANQAKAQARQRLAPVLSRLGVTKAAAKRTPARKKAKAVRSRRAA